MCESTGRKQAEAVVVTGRVLFFFADSCNKFCGLNIDLILPVCCECVNREKCQSTCQYKSADGLVPSFFMGLVV